MFHPIQTSEEKRQSQKIKNLNDTITFLEGELRYLRRKDRFVFLLGFGIAIVLGCAALILGGVGNLP